MIPFSLVCGAQGDAEHREVTDFEMKGERVAESQYLFGVEDPAHPNVAVNMKNNSTVLTWFIRNGQAPPTRHLSTT